jgi:large subunit ribosomal protein L21
MSCYRVNTSVLVASIVSCSNLFILDIIFPTASVAQSHELILKLANDSKVFSVIELSGKQYKVTLQDVITCHRLQGLELGETIPLEKVLLVGNSRYTVIGNPHIDQTYFRLYATVIEQGKGPKMFIERFKRRKNYDRRIGHRQYTTTLKISAYEVGPTEQKDITSLTRAPSI